MAVQTTYSENLDAGRLGAIADTNDKTLISRLAEVGAIGFGLPVVQGSNGNGAHKAKTGDTAILGVTVRERSAIGDQYAVGDAMRVMTKGVIWVVATVDVTAGDTVAVKVADATFEKSADTGVIAIANARYDSSATAGDLVKIRLA